jgi:PAS domain S-box-containing protein
MLDKAGPRAAIFAPGGRDAAVASGLLGEAGIAGSICRDLAEFERALGGDSTFALVTEEAIRAADLAGVVARLREQPPWSDLPIIVLTRREGDAERKIWSARTSELLGNVTYLERPFHPSTFISVARSALKGRQRQYEARSRIEELREGQERLRTALSAGRLGPWEFDFATSTLTASAACKSLFGHTPHQRFTQDDAYAAVHPDDRARLRAAVTDTLETGAEYMIEYRAVWPDGGVHWIETRARLVTDAATGAPRLVGVSSDITGRKTSEQELRRLNETLEERVAARTLELRRAHEAVLAEIRQRERAEEQLRQSQKMEMIGQLTGGVAHDFNNLLMAVTGNLELLRKRLPEDPKWTRLLDGAMQGATRGKALTQRLLAFARQQELRVEPRNLVDLVRGMSDLIERSVGSQIEVRIDLPATLPPALLDANQVELALLNLVVNARDAMPDGGRLTIDADAWDADPKGELPVGRYIRLRVRDTGQGMTAETLRKATEPFFSTKGVGKGTGLGLSMAHGLAVQLNGALRLNSEIGRGTRVELWLPATNRAPTAEAMAAPERPAAARRAKVKILFVDDDALIATSTVDLLNDLGHDVIEANSGQQALDILSADSSIDLLITDFSMPRMSGAQLAEKAHEILPKLPVLLATGYAELPSGLGADLPRIAKPYRQEKLAEEIGRLMAGR